MINDPVFVDRTGRRHRFMLAASAVGGLCLLLAVGVLLAGFTGTGPAAVPGWPAPAATHKTSRPPAIAPTTKTAASDPTRDDKSRAPEPTRQDTSRAPATTPAATPTATSIATPITTPTDRPTNRGRKPSSHPSRNTE